MGIEDDILRIGLELFEHSQNQIPTLFDKGWWSGKMMGWSMRDPAFKVEMFRFVDVFSVLDSSQAIAEHLKAYFSRPEQDFPAAMQWGLRAVNPSSLAAKAIAATVRRNILQMARRFIAGASPDEALKELHRLWKGGVAHTVDLLGEATVSEREAQTYVERYLALLDTLAAETPKWEERPELCEDAWGPLPRANVSVKLSALYSQIDPLDFDASVAALRDRVRPLFERAVQDNVFLNVDLEQYTVKAITYRVFAELLQEPALRDYPHFGVVVQAYQHASEADTEALIALAQHRGAPITVRLVKGAYWDYETVQADQHGWPSPVFRVKARSDQQFERLSQKLIDASPHIKLAVGSHNIRSIAHAIAYARRRGLPDNAVEYQNLYGMAEPIQHALREQGLRVRAYVPVGELIPGMAYLVRRLLENTSNEGFLRMTFVDDMERHRLLQRPDPEPEPNMYSHGDNALPPFRNEPLADFREADARDSFGAAVRSLGETLDAKGPVHLPLRIAGSEVDTEAKLSSEDPQRPDRIIATTACAGATELERALQSAGAAFEVWRDTTVEERAEILFTAAAWMRRRRDALAALEVYECAKPWREADGDVCEAIDFLEYYGREALRLDAPRALGGLPGEDNRYFYEGRGPTAVIAPWNFPLAIPTGMTAAALAAGNPVLLKPAEQSPAIAARLVDALLDAGLPPGCISYLPGRGEEVGAALVRDKRVACVTFTGSKAVGLDIIEAGARVAPGQRNIKKIVAEMGGKNAIIIDDDADLDEAVLGTLYSAFGFSGQKCSACSRVIVLPAIREAFVERLVEAARSVQIGPATDPGCYLGPVIDAEAQARVRRYVELGQQEGEALLIRDERTDEGHYAPLAIFGGIQREHRLAREEIFGPVLAVMEAGDIEEALEIALDCEYGLTGGVFSRNPHTLERCRREFRVGNLYINRGTTGALVGRQPFGGARMSGIGSKAGGPDYLLQFMEPRCVTENTLRRGFAPEL